MNELKLNQRPAHDFTFFADPFEPLATRSIQANSLLFCNEYVKFRKDNTYIVALPDGQIGEMEIIF